MYRKNFDEKTPGWLEAAISKITSFRNPNDRDKCVQKSLEKSLVISDLSDLFREKLRTGSDMLRSEIENFEVLADKLFMQHKNGRLRCERRRASVCTYLNQP